MNKNLKYTFYTGGEVWQNKQLFDKIEVICKGYDDFKEEGILEFLDDTATICCMSKNGDLIGFSWCVISEKKQEAELCWLVMDKNKAKGFDGKQLLDKTLEYCKKRNIKSLKFNCYDVSWKKIKDKDKLLTRYGYNIDKNEKDYDVSIII